MYVPQILVIAPNKTMLPLLQEETHNFPDAHFTLQTGDLYQGVLQATNTYHADFDVIISRGGTAEELADEMTAPIVEIRLSTEDILKNLHDANPHKKPCAVVGFKNALRGFEGISPYLDYTLDLFEVDFDDEVDDVLRSVSHKNYGAVISDTVTHDKAKAFGLTTHLLASGKASIDAAYQEAIRISSIDDKLRDENHLLWNLAHVQDAKIVVYNNRGLLIYSDLEDDMKEIADFIAQHRNTTDSKRLVIQRHGIPYTIIPRTLDSDEGYQAFVVRTARGRAKHAYLGISYANVQEVRRDYENSIFAIVEAGNTLMPQIRKLAASREPVMIEGEIGVGKEQIARLLYLESTNSKYPLVTLNAKLINAKGWEYLLESQHSPLYEKDLIFFFENIDALSPKTWKKLLELIVKTRLQERCWLIFSGSKAPDGQEVEQVSTFVDLLHAITLSPEPLRRWETRAQTPLMYLTHLARMAGTPTPRLSAETQKLLFDYQWPRNLLQLREVLNRLWALQNNGLITAEATRKVLDKERGKRYVRQRSSAEEAFNFMRPLQDIEYDVASTVIEACDGNKTKAARILGISRTTLWRLLKDAQHKV